jgi:hypothetical protein
LEGTTRIELNVTDSTNNVSSDSVADQSTLIRDALDLLGHTIPNTGPSYAKTAYFPAGTYYISSNLLYRIQGSDYTDVTLRGDGPGATILKGTCLPPIWASALPL